MRSHQTPVYGIWKGFSATPFGALSGNATERTSALARKGGGSLLPFPNTAWTPENLDRKLVNPYVKVLSCLPELALELGAPAPRSCRDVHAVYHEAGCCGDAEASTDVIF